MRSSLFLLPLALLAVAGAARGEPETAADPGDPTIHVGRGAVPRTVAAIDGAQRSLDAALYKFDEPSLLEAVERALARGVRVRIVVDAANARGKSLVGAVERTEALVRRWPPKQGKMHAKLMVVDGRQAIAGSFNWTRSAARSNVELALVFEDPQTVKRLAEAFESFWDRAAAAP